MTTPLIDKIVEDFDAKSINTLTGFEYICEKMEECERNLLSAILSDGGSLDHTATSVKKARISRQVSHIFVFGCKKSYGYLSSDVVHDKVAGSAVLML